LRLSRKHKFGKAEFCLPDFEFVNRCAYFDYERDRAYLRIKKNLSILKPRATSKKPRRAKVNKRIEIRLHNYLEYHQPGILRWETRLN
jgi:hypothetical protein